MPRALLNLLRPPELPQSDSKEEQRAYRARVNRYHFNVAACVAALLIATSWAASPYGFARADDVQPQIDRALEPVKQEQATLKSALNEVAYQQNINSKRLVKSLANTLASEMRFLQSKICTPGTEPFEKERLRREIDRKQDEYFELRTNRYPIPNCAEL